MARKKETYVVQTDGRDLGKQFIITEMAAGRGEAWAMRALLALMNNNVNLPDGFERRGMAGMAEVGLKALSGLQWEVAEPLLLEMWSCVQYQPDPAKPHILRPVFEEDIEEISTRIELRFRIWGLHVDFLKAVAPLVSGEKATATPAN